LTNVPANVVDVKLAKVEDRRSAPGPVELAAGHRAANGDSRPAARLRG
jgi:hypothetical protein